MIVLEKIPHQVENIIIDFGIFRKGDMLRTFRSTNTIPTINLNWKYNKCVINLTEPFRNIYPTINTFFYMNIKALTKDVTIHLLQFITCHIFLSLSNRKTGVGHFTLSLTNKNVSLKEDLSFPYTPKITSLMLYSKLDSLP